VSELARRGPNWATGLRHVEGKPFELRKRSKSKGKHGPAYAGPSFAPNVGNLCCGPRGTPYPNPSILAPSQRLLVVTQPSRAREQNFRALLASVARLNLCDAFSARLATQKIQSDGSLPRGSLCLRPNVAVGDLRVEICAGARGGSQIFMTPDG
jgi:hypothetical protein